MEMTPVIPIPRKGIKVGRLTMTGYLVPSSQDRAYGEDLRVYRCDCCGNNIAIAWGTLKYIASKHTSRGADKLAPLDIRCAVGSDNQATRFRPASCLGYPMDRVTDPGTIIKKELVEKPEPDQVKYPGASTYEVVEVKLALKYLPFTAPPRGHDADPDMADDKWCTTCSGSGVVSRSHPTIDQKIDRIDAKLAQLLTRLDGYTGPRSASPTNYDTNTDADGLGPK